MTDQTLRLNKIEIGQFLNMKNKVGIPNNNGKITKLVIRSGPLYLSNKRPAKTVNVIVLTMTKKPLGKSLGTFNSLPSLFTKISFLTKYVLLNIISNVDIHSKVANLVRLLISPSFGVPTISSKINPADIPSQNTRFQKLSLFISYLKVKYHTYILPYLVRPCKLIRYFLVYFLITLGTKVSFASDMPQLIQKIEKEHEIPSGLLAAIASVESGLKPYAIGVSGKSVKASSKEEAKKIIKQYLAKGITNIDVGIMQINWRWHSKEFDQDLDDMLNPLQNIMYAAQLLKSLHEKHQSWQKAVRHYHSAKDEYHRKYSKAVLVSWLKQN